jgi:hypothetical protein
MENEKDENERIMFTIKCTMKRRWARQFLSMLKYMQFLGNAGGSRKVALYADGDGDFRPKFEWSNELPADARPIKDENGNHLYDAG